MDGKNPYIGQLDRKIQIIREVLTQNNMGEQQPVEQVVISPFAQMQEAGGSEDVDGKVRHLIKRKYVIRYNADVLTNGHKYIVLDSGVRYAVYHVMELGRKKHLVLLVQDYE